MDGLFVEYTGKTTAKCVAAIDFGTSGTSYAYAFPPRNGELNARTDVYTNGQWEDGSTGKTKTILLLDDENNFIAFGGHAENKYKVLAVHKSGKYFRFFKMQLYTEKITGNFMIKPLDALLKQIQMEDRKVSSSDIKWVLTVPAIWNDAAKQIMSEAAETAGLVNVGGNRVQLALEPEAASLWCLRNGELNLEHGDRYVVLDCGGGTIDVTVHEKIAGMAGDSLKEMALAKGGDWGSTTIDRRILRMLKDIFGNRRYNAMTEDLHGYMNLQRDIESAKIAFDSETDVVLNLPDTLMSQTYTEVSPEEAVEKYQNANGNVDLIFRKPNLLIPATYFRDKLIWPTIQQIYTHTLAVLNRNPSVSRLILAGNFANSRILRDEMMKFESRGIKVVVPHLPGETVVKGAVLFGANPGLISERLSRFTYGIGTVVPFVTGKHPESKLIITSFGERFCNGVFNTFITEGEECVLGHTVEKPFTTLEPYQHIVGVNIYKSRRKNVTYTEEAGVTNIGRVAIRIRKPFESVKVIMLLTTEIVAKAINEDGEEREVTLKFNE
ncbi:hypothetical protein BC938DRAFT_472428 [Jimgerdemannia flammicorona]|uniref:Uncharacterized protein n=1 Tax=Jimgerdemannia flammicorona TaxID=994334 RepID=A0A433QZX4_9FUNG|nr:hypothetical protein BC938DRAFT_472428 [Jimgerdemannia flammicorona]